MGSVSSVKKAAMALFLACLLLILVTSGYWKHHPDPYSKCEALTSAVPVYPAKHSAAVFFAGKGTTSSKQIIDALAKDGIEATNF